MRSPAAFALLSLCLAVACDKGPDGDTAAASDSDPTGHDSAADTDSPPEACAGFSADYDLWDVPGPWVYDYFMSARDVGSYLSLLDLTGDGLPDLVVTQPHAGEPDPGAAWRVFPSTGAGFGGEITWAVPTDDLDHPHDPNFHHATLDVDGDGLPDMVRAQDPDTLAAWGGDADPHWRVALNTGDGFAAEVDWPVPSALFDQVHANASYQNWTTLDLDGDGQVELIHTSDPDTAGNFGFTDGAPHWRVYPVEGQGFADQPEAWALPEGLDVRDGWYTSASDTAYGKWTTSDIDGDGLLDLVVPRSDAYPYPVWGEAGAWYWQVHFNRGDGFDAAGASWSIPSDFFDFPSEHGDWVVRTSTAWATRAPGRRGL